VIKERVYLLADLGLETRHLLSDPLVLGGECLEIIP